MDNLITPTIITDRAATKHLETIKAAHSNILQDMQNQKVRVDAYNQEQSQMRAAEKQQNDQRMADTQKAAMEYSLKTKELALKEQDMNTTV